MPPCAYLPASLTRPRDRSAGVRRGAISPSRSWGHSIEIERGRGGYGGEASWAASLGGLLRMGPLAIGAALRSWPRAPMLMLPGRARSDEFQGRPVSDQQDGRRKYCRPGPCCCAARSPTAAQGYGTGPAAIMLIDRAVSAYQEFVRVTGWIGNLAIHIEREF